ncbi:invasion associated locus B family protein [Arenibacterium sp. CAU 1754]
MIKLLSSLSVVSLMAFGGPVLAQQAQTETPTETEQTAETPAPAGTEAPAAQDSPLDLGQPVDKAPKLGERYSKEKFGDWDLACIRTEAETDPCSLLQVLVDDQGNAIAEVSLFRISNGSQAVAGATVVVPLETLLPAQLTIAVDSDPGKRYNYSFCNPIGCVAQIGLTEADVNAFKRGNAAKISLRPAPAPDQVVELKLSLNGFTAGYNAVDVVTE